MGRRTRSSRADTFWMEGRTGRHSALSADYQSGRGSSVLDRRCRDDCVPGYYSIGIRTYTSSIATVAPKLSLMLHEVASIPDPANLSQLMNDYVIPLYPLRSRRKGYEVSIMKEMMNQLGMAAGPVRPPLPQVTAEDKKLVRQMLENWSPVLSSGAAKTIRPQRA